MPVTLLHWNIETYGPGKFISTNNPNFVNYIASLVHHVRADVFAMVEVKNSIAHVLPPLIADAVNAIEVIAAADNPWRWVRADSGFNSEAYIIMYRTDRDIAPIRLTQAQGTTFGANVIPDHGLGRYDADNLELQFPSRMTPRGGRRPFFATFTTTDMNDERTFSVISYHAMVGAHTPRGIHRLPFLNVVTEFPNAPYDDLDFSMLSGDFNVDFNAYRGDYQFILNLPSSEATLQRTSMQNNPGGGDVPATFMANAYDNIFQTYDQDDYVGRCINLMIESAVVFGPQPPPPAAQPNEGTLSAAAGAFNLAAVNQRLRWSTDPVTNVPPGDMNNAWRFVREAISNHYPVVLTVNT